MERESLWTRIRQMPRLLDFAVQPVIRHALCQLHMYGLAIKLSQRGLKRWPHFRAFQLAELGRTRSDAGDLEGALECLREACDLEPDNASYHLSLSAIYQEHGKLVPAIEHCERF